MKFWPRSVRGRMPACWKRRMRKESVCRVLGTFGEGSGGIVERGEEGCEGYKKWTREQAEG